MQYLNIHTSFLDSDAFLSEEPVNRATWLCLMRYCAGQENGGRITDCRNWKDRRWQQVCRVTQAETQAKSRLWVWENDDLILHGYPSETEAKLKKNREAGRKGGQSTSDAKADAARNNGSRGGRPQSENPSGNPSETQAETQRKEKKGKERKTPPLTPQGGQGSGCAAGGGGQNRFRGEADAAMARLGIRKTKRRELLDEYPDLSLRDVVAAHGGEVDGDAAHLAGRVVCAIEGGRHRRELHAKDIARAANAGIVSAISVDGRSFELCDGRHSVGHDHGLWIFASREAHQRALDTEDFPPATVPSNKIPKILLHFEPVAV